VDAIRLDYRTLIYPPPFSLSFLGNIITDSSTTSTTEHPFRGPATGRRPSNISPEQHFYNCYIFERVGRIVEEEDLALWGPNLDVPTRNTIYTGCLRQRLENDFASKYFVI
jgi:hypothetical protein